MSASGPGSASLSPTASLADGASVPCHSWSAHDAGQPWGTDPAGIDGVVRELAAPEGRLDHVELDLAEAANAERLVARAVDRFGHVDVLVVNHARSSGQSLPTVPAEELDLSWAVNARTGAAALSVEHP